MIDRHIERPPEEARDTRRLAASLCRWLDSKLENGRNLTISAFERSSTGYSNETYYLQAEWETDKGSVSEKLVVRLKPTRDGIYPEYDFARQVKLLRALHERTDIPVVEIRWYEEDPAVIGTEFYVMKWETGRAPNDTPPLHSPEGWFAELMPQQRGAICRSTLDRLIDIHDVDIVRTRLDFLDRPEFGQTGADQQLGYYRRAYHWAYDGSPQPDMERALDWLTRNRPAEETVALCWGDSRPGNILVRDNSCALVLDWEMATIGAPALDLSHWFYSDDTMGPQLGFPLLEGYMTPTEMVEYYESQSGRELTNLPYYMVFSGFRMAVVFKRMSAITLLNNEAEMAEVAAAIEGRGIRNLNALMDRYA